MKIEVNISKKYAFLIVGFLIFIGLVVAVSANWENVVRTVWHEAKDTKITIEGQNYSIQEAFDLGKLGSGVIINGTYMTIQQAIVSGDIVGTGADYVPTLVNGVGEDVYMAPVFLSDHYCGGMGGLTCGDESGVSSHAPIPDECPNYDAANKFGCGLNDSFDCLDVYADYILSNGGSYYKFYKRNVSCRAAVYPVKVLSNVAVGGECLSDGLMFTLRDQCIDDGGIYGEGESLNVYCSNHIVRWCLSGAPCPWKDNPTLGRTLTDTCVRSALSSNWMARIIGSCTGWKGYTNYYCGDNNQIYGT